MRGGPRQSEKGRRYLLRFSNHVLISLSPVALHRQLAGVTEELLRKQRSLKREYSAKVIRAGRGSVMRGTAGNLSMPQLQDSI